MSGAPSHPHHTVPIVALGLWLGTLTATLPASAQSSDDSATPSGAMTTSTGSEPAPSIFDPNILPAGCASCGGAGGGTLGPAPIGAAGVGGCTTCGGLGRSPCVPKHEPCCPCELPTWCGRFACCLYECLCCPDPCYQPRWIPIADAAFFVESARPITQQRLRWVSGTDLRVPDRSEYFWAREMITRFPQFAGGKGPNIRFPYSGEVKVYYDDLLLYTEVAASAVSFFTEISYRDIDPLVANHASGLGDMNLGTKSLLYDCELLQLTFQFKTYLPTGNFLKGLGNGHVSLEPSIILNIKCGPESYLQTQVAEWIPIGGDSNYQGSILHCHMSYNHVLWRPIGNVPLIGTLEASTWSFQHGLYTDPTFGPNAKSSGFTYVSAGPGLRLVVCDRADIGMGTHFSITTPHFASPELRGEIRWRF